MYAVYGNEMVGLYAFLLSQNRVFFEFVRINMNFGKENRLEMHGK